MLTHNTNMVNITLSVPEELHKKMQKHTELKWSDIARKSFEMKLEEIELFKNLLKRSKLTEKDSEVFGHKVKTEIRERFN